MLSIRSFTLLCALSLILAVVFPAANARLDAPSARHVPAIHRMLKKRTPTPQLFGGSNNAAGADDTSPPARGGVQNDAQPQSSPDEASALPSGRSSAATPSQAAPTNTPTRALATPVASQSPPAASNTASATPTNGGLVPGLVSGLLGSSSSSSSSSLSSSSTSISTSSTSSSSIISTSSTPTATPTVLAETSSLQQVTVTSTSSSESATPTESTGSHSVTKLQRNTIIILVAIGASIGAAGLIWTIIRKWKFRPSSSFEDRMQPIDWQPTTAGDRDIAEKLNRSASSASHGSFTSGGHGRDHLTADLPQHDFTAGAAHLAPVGGYADLQRGPSPQPDLHAGPNYRSPSPYHYDVPNPHGAYYNNAGGYQGGYDNNRGY